MVLTAFGAIGAKMPTRGVNYCASKAAVWIAVVLVSPQAVAATTCCCASVGKESPLCCAGVTQATEQPCCPCPETCLCERPDFTFPTLPQRHSEAEHDWFQPLADAFLNSGGVQVYLPLLTDWPVVISGSERCIAHCRLDL